MFACIFLYCLQRNHFLSLVKLNYTFLKTNYRLFFQSSFNFCLKSISLVLNQLHFPIQSCYTFFFQNNYTFLFKAVTLIFFKSITHFFVSNHKCLFNKFIPLYFKCMSCIYRQKEILYKKKQKLQLVIAIVANQHSPTQYYKK